MNIKAIIDFLDNHLTRTGRQSIDPVEANALLEKAGLLRDSMDRPGKPLRGLLRSNKLPHAYQTGGKGSNWVIPHSKNNEPSASNYTDKKSQTKEKSAIKLTRTISTHIDTTQLKDQLEHARQKYKPANIKYLLIAEAPPDSIERFFYYDHVRQHDYLFLGVAQALYPDLKDKFLVNARSSTIKNEILQNLKADGYYLLDLSELPLSFMTGNLYSQLPSLVAKIKKVANYQTKIVLIKATVYDTAFQYLQSMGIKNIADHRIPFPGQGGQNLFQIEFKKALKTIG